MIRHSHTMDRTHFLLLFLVQFCSVCIALAAKTNLTTDQSALLALKAHITSDPQNILVNWSTTTSICNWVGVTCGAPHLRVSVLNLSYMGFMGTIPPDLGNLSFLVELRANNNSFHGTLPQELSSLHRLKLISFGYNNFAGTIPSWFGSFPKLQTFYLYGNRFSGSIPTSIYNLSSLEVMNLNNNQLSGTIPREIRNLTKLKEIHLDYNNFTEIPNEIGSIELQVLSVQFNGLKGPVPKVIFNMSSLTNLGLTGNILNGGLPDNICQHLPNIERLYLSYNQFDGHLPSNLWQCRELLVLSLSVNNFTGSIPESIGNSTKLTQIFLGFNNVTGSIPDGIGNLSNLTVLNLAHNQLSGSIPTLRGLTYILHINLSSNSLTGSLSPDIGKLKVLKDVDLSNNCFSGIIPGSIGGLENLVDLSLANNYLNGPIPGSFGNLLSLELLDLSKNNLSGVIPKSLEALLHLKNLNVSFNRLQGEIPTDGPFENFSAQSFVSNDALCGAPRLHVPLCKNSTSALRPSSEEASISVLKYIIPGILLAMLLWIFIWLFILGGKRNVEVSTMTIVLPQLQCRKVSHQELQMATDGFNESNLLGTGSFGAVYKGTLSNGQDVAVKVFNLQLEGAFKTLDSECEVLSNICHQNIITIIGNCNEIDFKALVLNYMPNGSLERWLYSEMLNILERLNIMIDVASGLEYLHHDRSIPIIHSDLKPSNILLDYDMVAYVADFGIAKLLGGGDSMIQTISLATMGYMAPEYGMDGIVSTMGDVYSFGILLIEAFTERKPTDEMFIGEMNLKQWVANSLLDPHAVVEVVAANLLGTKEDHDFSIKGDCLYSIMTLALACSEEFPEKRINMQEAVVTLNKIKIKFLKETEDAGDIKC